MHIIMQTSPMSSPRKSQKSSPTSSPGKSQMSPTSLRGEIANELPSPPRKLKRDVPKGIPGIPFLTTILVKILSVIGKGSFGIVYDACFSPPPGSLPGTPDSPLVAVKVVDLGKKGVSKRDLSEEAERLGSPGHVPGYAFMNMLDNTYMAFMPKGISFDNINFKKMTKEKLEDFIAMTKEAIWNADSSVIPDIKPANMMLLPAGTPTVVKNHDGQPDIGLETTTEDKIFVCDLGSCDPIDGGDPLYSVLPNEKDVNKPDFDMKLRNFKALMMEAWIRDANEPSGKSIQEIVAPFCPFPWNYAGGVHHQGQCQRLFN